MAHRLRSRVRRAAVGRGDGGMAGGRFLLQGDSADGEVLSRKGKFSPASRGEEVRVCDEDMGDR